MYLKNYSHSEIYKAVENMNSNGFRLVPKFYENVAVIYCAFNNGGTYEICKIAFPRDNQQIDNYECVKLIIDALRKRIRKSL